MTDLSILPILQKIPIFSGLDERVHHDIIKTITLQFYPAGYELFKQGELGDKMYIIKSGQVKITKGSNDVATLGDHDFFGELALVSDGPRNATATTSAESEIFILDKKDLGLLLANNPAAEDALKKAVISRN